MQVFVKFEDGESYSISDTGVIRKAKGTPSVLVVKQIRQDMLPLAIAQKLKLFECSDQRDECLAKLTKIMFPHCKTCRFE